MAIHWYLYFDGVNVIYQITYQPMSRFYFALAACRHGLLILLRSCKWWLHNVQNIPTSTLMVKRNSLMKWLKIIRFKTQEFLGSGWLTSENNGHLPLCNHWGVLFFMLADFSFTRVSWCYPSLDAALMPRAVALTTSFEFKSYSRIQIWIRVIFGPRMRWDLDPYDAGETEH